MNYSKKSVDRINRQLSSNKIRIGKKFSVFFYKTLLVCFFTIATVSSFAVFGILRGIIDSAPNIGDIDPSPTGFLSKVYDVKGNETAALVASGSNRVYVPLKDIPEYTQQAFIAIEDERFYEHNGIDIKGIIRAGITGITSGGFSEGASTITQQLLKNNVFTGWVNESTFMEKVQRKLQEQYLAIELTKTKSKDWVLENYLNTINLGQNTLGVQAASLRYFGKDISELTLSESAAIAAITQNPTKWNPITNEKNNMERRKSVLKLMKEQKYITQKQYDEALADNVYARIKKVNIEYESSSPNSYFVDALIEQIVRDLVEIKGYTDTQAYKALYQGGLTIESTQDPSIQAVCDEEMNNPANYPANIEYSFSYRLSIQKADGTLKHYGEQDLLNYYVNGSETQPPNSSYTLNYPSEEEALAAINGFKNSIMQSGDTLVDNGEVITFTLQPQASISIMDHHTGEVKAIVGGRGDKIASRTLNRATNTLRQPGSLFKILAAYAPALDTANMTLGTVQDDAPFSYTNGTSLKNYNNKYLGYTNIRTAITNSINIVTVKTFNDISPQVGYDYLLNFGFTTLVQDDIVESLALGGITDGVSNLELTAAFSSIANQGTFIKPRFYTRILDHDGNVLIDNTPQTHTVLKDTTAYLLTDAMQDVVMKGTGTAVNFGGMPIAGKTGTTTKNRDALFGGYTPYYTCTVWGGYDDNSEQFNTAYPKTLWHAIMSRVHAELPYQAFEKPESIVTATICKKSGKLAVGGLCDSDPRGNMAYSEYFAAETVPTEYCDRHGSAQFCIESGYLANEFCPAESRITQIYQTDGSANTADGDYLLHSSTPCPIHNATTVMPEIPEIPEIPDPLSPEEILPEDNLEEFEQVPRDDSEGEESR